MNAMNIPGIGVKDAQKINELVAQVDKLTAENKTLTAERDAARVLYDVGRPKPYCGAECLGTCEQCKADWAYRQIRFRTPTERQNLTRFNAPTEGT